MAPTPTPKDTPPRKLPYERSTSTPHNNSTLQPIAPKTNANTSYMPRVPSPRKNSSSRQHASNSHAGIGINPNFANITASIPIANSNSIADEYAHPYEDDLNTDWGRKKAVSTRDSSKFHKAQEYQWDRNLGEVVDAERCGRCRDEGWPCYIWRDSNSPRRVCLPCGKNRCPFSGRSRHPRLKIPLWDDRNPHHERARASDPTPESNSNDDNHAAHLALAVPTRFESRSSSPFEYKKRSRSTSAFHPGRDDYNLRQQEEYHQHERLPGLASLDLGLVNHAPETYYTRTTPPLQRDASSPPSSSYFPTVTTPPERARSKGLDLLAVVSESHSRESSRERSPNPPARVSPHVSSERPPTGHSYRYKGKGLGLQRNQYDYEARSRTPSFTSSSTFPSPMLLHSSTFRRSSTPFDPVSSYHTSPSAHSMSWSADSAPRILPTPRPSMPSYSSFQFDDLSDDAYYRDAAMRLVMGIPRANRYDAMQQLQQLRKPSCGPKL